MSFQPSPSEINPLLAKRERVLWNGRPKQGLLFRKSDAFMIPFSLMWGGFAIFWETTVIKSGAPFFFMLWGIPFVLVGLYMIVGRFFADAWQRTKTFYTVTNERILIVGGLFNRTVTSLELRTLPEMSLSLQDDDKGTLSFGEDQTGFGSTFGGRWSQSNQKRPPQFEGIPDAAGVMARIREAQAALLRPAPAV
jgi:hypothetical protein